MLRVPTLLGIATLSLVCSFAANSHAQNKCVDRVSQPYGICTGCITCVSGYPSGYCGCEWLNDCYLGSCNQHYFWSPGCERECVGEVGASLLGYPRSCRLAVGPLPAATRPDFGGTAKVRRPRAS
jgi:hypothetical protein